MFIEIYTIVKTWNKISIFRICGFLFCYNAVPSLPCMEGQWTHSKLSMFSSTSFSVFLKNNLTKQLTGGESEYQLNLC